MIEFDLKINNEVRFIKTFGDLISNNYTRSEQGQLQLILDELDNYSAIETALNDFYISIARSNQIESISILALTIEELVTLLYNPLTQIKDNYKRAIFEQKIAELLAHLIKEMQDLSKLDLVPFLDLLNLIVSKTCLKYCWNFSSLTELLNTNRITSSEIKLPLKNDSSSKPYKLEWRGKQHLDLFIDDLRSFFPGVSSKKVMYQLFEDNRKNFKIELPSKYLLSFLTLFYKLHTCRTIKVHGNRGLFVYLHNHLVPPSKQEYPKRDFRKLRYDAQKNVKIKCKIDRHLDPLLKRYCLKEI